MPAALESSAPIPETLDELSPDWLSQALGTSLPGVRVRDIEVLERHAGTTGRGRLALRYAAAPADAPETVFVKLPPFDDAQRGMVAFTDMGRREARFYQGLASEMPVRVPRPWFAAAGDSPHRYIMVLEDLEAAGCTFPKLEEEAPGDRGTKVIEGLARCHAHFWNDARFENELSWVTPAMRAEIGVQLVGRSLELFGAEFPPLYGELGRLYIDHHEAVGDLWDEGESTLIHGDCHAGNLFVDGGQLGFYDWAVASRSPGVRDVANFLCHSLPTGQRREQQAPLVRRYHEALIAEGVDAPGFDRLWRRYQRLVLYGWVAATSTAAMGDKWQPLHVVREAMQRATTTCADLGTLEAFREDL